MTDQCEYAHEAIEELLKRCMRLEEENKELKEQLTRALTLLEETRKETYE
jgi:hypothetical protein